MGLSIEQANRMPSENTGFQGPDQGKVESGTGTTGEIA